MTPGIERIILVKHPAPREQKVAYRKLRDFLCAHPATFLYHPGQPSLWPSHTTNIPTGTPNSGTSANHEGFLERPSERQFRIPKLILPSKSSAPVRTSAHQ